MTRVLGCSLAARPTTSSPLSPGMAMSISARSGRSSRSRRKRLPAVRSLADHLDAGERLEQRTEPCPHQGMVIGQNDAQDAHVSRRGYQVRIIADERTESGMNGKRPHSAAAAGRAGASTAFRSPVHHLSRGGRPVCGYRPVSSGSGSSGRAVRVRPGRRTVGSPARRDAVRRHGRAVRPSVGPSRSWTSTPHTCRRAFRSGAHVRLARQARPRIRGARLPGAPVPR